MAEGNKSGNDPFSHVVAEADESGSQNYISSIVSTIIEAATKSENVLRTNSTSRQNSQIAVEKDTIPDGKVSSDTFIAKDPTVDELDTTYITDTITAAIEKGVKSKSIILKTTSTDELIQKDPNKTTNIREYITNIISNLINKATKSEDTSATMEKELTEKEDIQQYLCTLISILIEKVIQADVVATTVPTEIRKTEDYIETMAEGITDTVILDTMERRKSSNSKIDPVNNTSSIPKVDLGINSTQSLHKKILVYSQIFAEEFDTCNQYLDIGSFAQKFVDSIIEKAQNFVQKQTKTDKFSYIYPKVNTLELTTCEERECSMIEYDRPKFRGWPTIDEFSVPLGAQKINEYLSSFNIKEAWVYVIIYLDSVIEPCATLYNYEAIWSLPINQYPVAQATASMLFTIYVSKVMPPRCPVHVTFNFEGYRHLHTPSIADFNEDWLNYILDQKIAVFKTVTF